MRLFALDNTLGYCSGHQGLSFTLDDRLAIARELDRLGIHYIDAGCPAADRKAREFFARARADGAFTHARLVASARVEEIHDAVERDAGLHALLAAGTPVVALSWSCRQSDAGRLQDYCARIREAVRHLKTHAREVIFRAEDYFESFGAGALCALRMLEAAKAAGADVLCLCDSAGATLPQPLREICAEVRKRFDGILGICAQDDSDLAVANTLEAVEQGFTYVEGSINADGRRSGSVNLCSVIANLEYKLDHCVIGQENFARMFDAARFVVEAATVPLRRDPHGLEQAQTLLEGVDERLLAKLTDDSRRTLLDRIQLMEFDEYELRDAGGTMEVLVRESLYPALRPFRTWVL
jgi:2-isopropylmalate synthase